VTDGTRDEDQQDSSLRAFLLPVGAILAGVGVAIGLYYLVLDQQASANTVAMLYELLGNQSEADALRLGGGNTVVPKLLIAAIAMLVGVGGIWLFYYGLNTIVMRMTPRWRSSLLPWVFVGPALLLLTIWLVWPVIRTVVMSFTEGNGLANWQWALTNSSNHQMYFNNILWLVAGVAGAVGFGLLIAALLDRVKYEATAKTFIFLPLAISLIGASVIWRFIYVWRPEAQEQYGLLNAIVTSFGFDAVPWVQTSDYHVNTFALIFILIWLQTGFAMVVLSAAIKGVPDELLEAASLDGASERQKFFKIIVPMIRGSLIMVTITVAIVVLKVFDIVFTMTGGRFNTDVIANQMYVQAFQFFDIGRASVLAVVLFLAVLPLALLNIRNIRKQGMAA
jgi:alpha-glucoside transport system permease protein